MTIRAGGFLWPDTGIPFAYMPDGYQEGKYEAWRKGMESGALPEGTPDPSKGFIDPKQLFWNDSKAGMTKKQIRKLSEAVMEDADYTKRVREQAPGFTKAAEHSAGLNPGGPSFGKGDSDWNYTTKVHDKPTKPISVKEVIANSPELSGLTNPTSLTNPTLANLGITPQGLASQLPQSSTGSNPIGNLLQMLQMAGQVQTQGIPAFQTNTPKPLQQSQINNPTILKAKGV